VGGLGGGVGFREGERAFFSLARKENAPPPFPKIRNSAEPFSRKRKPHLSFFLGEVQVGGEGREKDVAFSPPYSEMEKENNLFFFSFFLRPTQR